jgi:hypothetical protein
MRNGTEKHLLEKMLKQHKITIWDYLYF